ncbi:MAG: M50 family metallopeptidase [Lachnospiraceae bacterium]|nr:M50 family metallopeptidase [Lachnospiraceae bacterium]
MSLLRAGGSVNFVSLLYTLLIICIVVTVHEFGHMIVAKSNGIYVKEFWVGFGPTILSFTKDDTQFCLKPVPFGGACIYEYDPECEDPDRLYSKANVWSRILTTFAGPLFNIILAFAFSVLVISLAWNTVIVTTELKDVTDGSPAYEAGLRPGDIIREYNGRNVDLSTEVIIFNTVCNGNPVRLTYEREGQLYSAMVKPEYSEEYGRYLFGITFGKGLDHISSMDILKYSVYYVRMNIRSTVDGLRGLFLGRLGMDSLSGPVGMAEIVDDVYHEAKQEGIPAVVLSMLNLALIISASLGIMNLLPLPGLDGGKLILLFIEALRRKPVSRDMEAIVNFVGFAVLMIITVMVLYNDILKFVRR